eukprot:CAMPEP_0202057720 /NCGR_PEP_ID=MMETSP0963-20130614/29397_1 /ASSEMBLY_ACC=CAM_ASM_000494 /TAXON_ID=4773 /ORGANISM="Schizochytrium aggregatum, Strain ATCC28209" /LENGTH=44 /DNA_ID= /DNA_START= /DNA_END= /DNA_ORIENTATION=
MTSAGAVPYAQRVADRERCSRKCLSRTGMQILCGAGRKLLEGWS